MDMTTVSGKTFRIGDPFNSTISLLDIAHSLSNICRYNGHLQQFYSVAEHSVYVSHLVPQEYALPALLHDAAEAYMGDITRPIRSVLGPQVQELENLLNSAITAHFALDIPVDHEVILEVDNQMTALERPEWEMDCRLKREGFHLSIGYWHPFTAKNRFI